MNILNIYNSIYSSILNIYIYKFWGSYQLPFHKLLWAICSVKERYFLNLFFKSMYLVSQHANLREAVALEEEYSAHQWGHSEGHFVAERAILLRSLCVRLFLISCLSTCVTLCMYSRHRLAVPATLRKWYILHTL